ncbi:hypothetical protein FXO38_02234 [Capsicum annuum]|nr:hypothetical protein FXO38_02234 [Capsicum annuum]
MDNNNNNTHQSPTEASAAAAAATAAAQSAAYPPETPYDHVLQQQLQMFWNYQRQEIEQATDFKNHQLPLGRIIKIMKADEDVRMMSAETPVLFAKACEMDEVKDEGVGLGLAPGGVPYYYPPLGQPDPGGVMLGRPAVPAGVVPGAVPGVVPGTVPGTVPGVVPGAVPGVDPSMYVPHLPFQVWQSMWQISEDHSYPSGGGSSSGQGTDDSQM